MGKRVIPDESLSGRGYGQQRLYWSRLTSFVIFQFQFLAGTALVVATPAHNCYATAPLQLTEKEHTGCLDM